MDRETMEQRSDIHREPELAAEAASLRYVHDGEPGLKRLKRGKGFRYVDADGRAVKDRATLDRVRMLAIPPAWTDVWICADDTGHVQAHGRDVKKRKQYRYHARWRSIRDEAKYDQIVSFAAVLPKLRAQIDADLSRPGLDKDKVIASVLRLMERTCVRIGNDCYAKENGSFGLTTLRDRHATIRGGELSLAFKGKSGKHHRIVLKDAQLAKLVKQCRDVPGQRLFQWLDETGQGHAISSTDVNAYLRAATGTDYSAKMLRTWHATALAAEKLAERGHSATTSASKRAVVACLEHVAGVLGNTPAICRKSYVHPAVLGEYVEGTFARRMATSLTRAKRRKAPWMTTAELAMVDFLRGAGTGETLALAA